VVYIDVTTWMSSTIVCKASTTFSVTAFYCETATIRVTTGPNCQPIRVHAIKTALSHILKERNPNTGGLPYCPPDCSGTPERPVHHQWRCRNRPWSCSARPSACNDRPHLFLLQKVGPDKSSFRRPSPAYSGLSVPSSCAHPLQGSHLPLAGRYSSSVRTFLWSRDARPKSWPRRRACRSTRAVELQRQRARGCARPAPCWRNPSFHSIYHYCMSHNKHV
jgi:hypothetical protein